MGNVIWHRFEFIQFVLWLHSRIYFGTATYVNYLTFLTLIRLLTQPPCKCTLTGRGSQVCPNNQGSRVYPNSQGTWVYPKGRGSRVYRNGQGSRARPGWGRRCARASPSRFALHAHGLGFALTTIKWIYLLQFNEFINFALQKIYECTCSTNSYLYEFIYLNH